MDRVKAHDRATIAAAGAVLARAFEDDPAYVWVFPEPEVRRAATAFLLPRMVRMYAPARHCWVLRDAPQGAVLAASVWAPPARTFGPLSYLRHGLAWLPLRFGPGALRRLLYADEAMKEVKARLAPPGGSFYLDTLGVDPSRQGEGLGSRLLRGTLSEPVDTSGRPATLFTTRPDNLPFYKRHGFEVLSESQIAGEQGFGLWYLARPARPGS